MEYLGAEVIEKEKWRDMEQNPHLCIWQNFGFDYVYDENST
jgi:GTPase SAR1 family protein